MDDKLHQQINQEWAKRLKENVEKIGSSEIFLSMLNGKFDDPLMLMQMGIAVYMDKPIYLLVNRGTKIPENLRKMAAGIEVVDYDNMDQMTAAIERITGKDK
jgi:hypothetical protein